MIKPIFFANIKKQPLRINSGFLAKTKPLQVDSVFLSGKTGSPKLNFVQKFLLNQKIKNSTQILQNFEEGFFSKTRSLKEAMIFEKNKKILEKMASLRNLSKQNRIDFYNILKQDFFNDDLSETIQEKLSIEELSLIQQKAKERYFSQKNIKSFNLLDFNDSLAPVDKNSEFRNKKVILSIIKKQNPELVSIFEHGEKITLDNSLIRTYSKEGEFYDLPYKFAIGINNQKQTKGNSYIKETIPEIFKGIKETELFSSLDTLSFILRKEGCLEQDSAIRFKIANIGYSADFIKTGAEKSVYRINKEDDCSSVIIKIYNHPNAIGSSDIFGNIAIEREATRAKCSDIAKFFFANPLNESFQSKNNEIFQKGSWEIVEDVSSKNCCHSLNNFLHWLADKGLWCYDIKKENNKNGFFIDFGFIAPCNMDDAIKRQTLNARRNIHINKLFESYKNGKTTTEIFEELQKV